MEASFWQQRWQSNKIGFHESEVNPMLTKHVHKLSLEKHDRVFVPLCGKTLDIHWLLAQGHRVVGAELSELAIDQLFDELNVSPVKQNLGNLIHYSSQQVDIFVGDFFNLNAELIGRVDAIYDRAALVALPEEMRLRYSPHLIKITSNAPQLLICFEYDQTAMDGPPFSISAPEVQQHYQATYKVSLIERIELPNGLRQQTDAAETAWLLSAT